MESRFLTGSINPAGIVVRSHFLLWIRSLDSHQLETRHQKKPFAASVGSLNEELSLAVRGEKIRVSTKLWESYLNRYFETSGATNLASYRECGPFASYLVRLSELFVGHLMDGRCYCLNINSLNVGDSDSQISPCLSRSN